MDNLEILNKLNENFKELEKLEKQYLDKKQVLDSKQNELSFKKHRIDRLKNLEVEEENREYEREVVRRKNALSLFLTAILISFVILMIPLSILTLNPFKLFFDNILFVILGSAAISAGNYIKECIKDYEKKRRRRRRPNHYELGIQIVSLTNSISDLEREIVFIKSDIIKIEERKKILESQNSYMLNYKNNNLENDFIENQYYNEKNHKL